MSEQSDQSDQQEAQEQSSKMAAAAASYQQSQLPGGHLSPGMDNTFHGDQRQQSAMIGDNTLFSFDNSSFSQLSMDSNQQPILNQNDNHYLSTFFDNPGIITNEFNPFDFSPSAEARPTTNGNSSLFAGAFFDYNSGTINPNTPGAYQRNSSQTNSTNLSADDYSAASTISNLKSNNNSSNYQANPNGLGGASWGAFMMPQQMPLNISMGNTPLVGANGQAPPQFFAHPQNMSIAPGSFPWQQSHANGNSRTISNGQARSTYYPPQNGTQGQPQTNQPPHFNGQQQPQGGRPPVYHFGSDQGFDGNRYSTSSAAPQPDGKAGNLLGVPGAAQAARPPNGLLPPQEQASQWAAEMARRNGIPPDHKRRKSGDGPPHPLTTPRAMPGDGTYETFADGSFKRRRSSHAEGPPGFAGSPMMSQDLINRNNRRETLSDAQKRENHIESEKKRRNLINQGYDDLNKLTPCLASGKSGLSRSECLQEIACYLESVIRGSDMVLSRLQMTRQDLANWQPRGGWPPQQQQQPPPQQRLQTNVPPAQYPVLQHQQQRPPMTPQPGQFQRPQQGMPSVPVRAPGTSQGFPNGQVQGPRPGTPQGMPQVMQQGMQQARPQGQAQGPPQGAVQGPPQGATQAPPNSTPRPASQQGTPRQTQQAPQAPQAQQPSTPAAPGPSQFKTEGNGLKKD